MKKLYILLVFLLVGCTSIKNEYENVEGKVNVKQIDEKEVVELFESGNGVLLFSFPECEWCQELMPVLNEKALELDIEVNYFNVRDIRASETDIYEDIYSEIAEYLVSIDYDMLVYDKLYVPTLVVVENGIIVDFHLGTTNDHLMKVDGLPKLNLSQVKELKEILDRMIK